MGRIKVTVSIGFAGARKYEEFDAPEDWDKMSEEERDRFLGECEEEAVSNHVDVFAEYLED